MRIMRPVHECSVAERVTRGACSGLFLTGTAIISMYVYVRAPFCAHVFPFNEPLS